jgi:hypothetical protein
VNHSISQTATYFFNSLLEVPLVGLMHIPTHAACASAIRRSTSRTLHLHIDNLFAGIATPFS